MCSCLHIGAGLQSDCGQPHGADSDSESGSESESGSKSDSESGSDSESYSDSDSDSGRRFVFGKLT